MTQLLARVRKEWYKERSIWNQTCDNFFSTTQLMYERAQEAKKLNTFNPPEFEKELEEYLTISSSSLLSSTSQFMKSQNLNNVTTNNNNNNLFMTQLPDEPNLFKSSSNNITEMKVNQIIDKDNKMAINSNFNLKSLLVTQSACEDSINFDQEIENTLRFTNTMSTLPTSASLQPQRVIYDTLHTLPTQMISDGTCQVIEHKVSGKKEYSLISFILYVY